MSLAKAWRVENVEGEAAEAEDQFGMTDEKEINDILVEEVKGRQRCDTWLDNLPFEIRVSVIVLSLSLIFNAPRLVGSSKVTLRSPTCSLQSLNRLTRAVGRSSISAAGGGSLLPANWGGRGSRGRPRGKR